MISKISKWEKSTTGWTCGVLEEICLSAAHASDLADQDIGRVIAAQPGGQNQDRQLWTEADWGIISRESSPVTLPSRSGLRCRRLQANIDGGGWVGNQLDPCRAGRHGGHAPHQALLGDDRHAAAQAIVGTAVDDHVLQQRGWDHVQ